MRAPTLSELFIRHAIHATQLLIGHKGNERTSRGNLRALLRLQLDREGTNMREKRIGQAMQELRKAGRRLKDTIARGSEGGVMKTRGTDKTTSGPRDNGRKALEGANI